MTLIELIGLLNQDLCNEYKHLLFYVHAANVLVGPERAYYVSLLKEHAASELQHVYQFAHKIRAHGQEPATGLMTNNFHLEKPTLKQIVNYSIQMEQEVIVNYHLRRKQAEALHDATGQHYDLVVFLEEQIEHSQHDVDELVQIRAGL